MNRASPLEDLAAGLAWLRSVAGELTDAPLRLHGHQVGASDLLGAPRMSGGFYARLTDSPYATRRVERPVRCPASHPMRSVGEPRCAMCDDTREWITTTDVYAHPLAAALSSLGRARSRLRPRPEAIVRALLGSSCDPIAAGPSLGISTPDDRRWLSALRALYDQFSYTVMAPARRPESGPDSSRVAAA
jgi:hypothetical protein